MRERRRGEQSDEELLPMLEWEVPSQRKRLPPELQRIIGAPTPILRVPRSIDTKIRTAHADAVEHYVRLGALLVDWRFIGVSTKDPSKWEIYLQNGVHWMIAVIGQDRSGSFNPVSLFRAKERNILIRYLRGEIQRREAK